MIMTKKAIVLDSGPDSSLMRVQDRWDFLGRFLSSVCLLQKSVLGQPEIAKENPRRTSICIARVYGRM